MKSWQRLDPLARGRYFLSLREKGWSYQKIARHIGKSPAFVVNSVRLLQLPEAVQDGLLAGLIKEGHAKALAGIGDTQAIIQAYKQILREHATVHRAEEIARRMRKQLRDKLKGSVPSVVETIEEKLKDKVAKVQIRQTQRQTVVRIEINRPPQEANSLLERIFIHGIGDAREQTKTGRRPVTEKGATHNVVLWDGSKISRVS